MSAIDCYDGLTEGRKRLGTSHFELAGSSNWASIASVVALAAKREKTVRFGLDCAIRQPQEARCFEVFRA